jgi:hypothetical protein
MLFLLPYCHFYLLYFSVQSYTDANLKSSYIYVNCSILWCSFQFYFHNEYNYAFRSKREVTEFLATGSVTGKGVIKKVPRYIKAYNCYRKLYLSLYFPCLIKCLKLISFPIVVQRSDDTTRNGHGMCSLSQDFKYYMSVVSSILKFRPAYNPYYGENVVQLNRCFINRSRQCFHHQLISKTII